MKSKIIRSALLGAMLATAFTAHAQAATSSTSPWTIELGTGSQMSTYKESMNGSTVMQLKGGMVGLTVGATRLLDNDAEVHVDFSYYTGSAKYTGSYWGMNYGSLVIPGDQLNQYELNGIYKMPVNGAHGAKVLLGMNYRQLSDDLGKVVSGGYYRENQRVSLVVGAEKEMQLSQAWSVTPRLLMKAIVHGQQYTDLYGGFTQHQRGWGGELAADINCKNADNTLTITPYLKTWAVNESNIVNAGGKALVEPKNTTKEIGISIAYKF